MCEYCIFRKDQQCRGFPVLGGSGALAMALQIQLGLLRFYRLYSILLMFLILVLLLLNHLLRLFMDVFVTRTSYRQ